MRVHYRFKEHPRYPRTVCGKIGIRLEVSENIDEVTCKRCKETGKKIVRVMGERSHERNQVAFRRDGLHNRIF